MYELGWRIEIKKYPKLQEVGSKRKETLIDYYFVNWPQIFDGKEHGGYYTLEEIKDIVSYAASKYITSSSTPSRNWKVSSLGQKTSSNTPHVPVTSYVVSGLQDSSG